MNHFEQLEERGVEYERGLGGRENQVRRIKLPWSPEEWLAIIDKEGDFLQMCCGNISAGRDILISSLREGGWLDTDELWKFNEWVFKHDGYDEESLIASASPLLELYRIWQIIEDDCQLPWASKPYEPDLSVPKVALRCVLDTGRQLSFDLLFDNSGESHRSQVNRTMLLAAFLPALRALNEHVAELDLGPIDGVGIYGPNGRLESTNYGLTICESEDEARRTLAAWERHESGSTDGLTLRRVRVSSDGGVEEGENISLD